MEEFTNKGFQLFGVDPYISSDSLSVKTDLNFPLQFPLYAAQYEQCHKLLKEKLRMTPEELQQKMNELDFDEVKRQLEDAIRAWSDIAGELTLLWTALRAHKAGRTQESTGNEWQERKEDYGFCEVITWHISNDLFEATIKISKDQKFRSEGYTWSVSYWLGNNLFGANSLERTLPRELKSASQKFSDEASAMKYANGRRDFLTKKCFYSQKPKVPKEFHGSYTYKDEEIPGIEYEA